MNAGSSGALQGWEQTGLLGPESPGPGPVPRLPRLTIDGMGCAVSASWPLLPAREGWGVFLFFSSSSLP